MGLFGSMKNAFTPSPEKQEERLVQRAEILARNISSDVAKLLDDPTFEANGPKKVRLERAVSKRSQESRDLRNSFLSGPPPKSINDEWVDLDYLEHALQHQDGGKTLGDAIRTIEDRRAPLIATHLNKVLKDAGL